MTNKIPKIFGTLIQGAGKAAFFTDLFWIQQQCREKIGFVPFSGTLNLDIKRSDVEFIKNISNRFWKELTPEDKTFCTAKILPIVIKDIKCAVILPEAAVNIHDRHVIEILAPVNLRESLGLKNGDTINIHLDEYTKIHSFYVDAVLFDLDGTLIDSIESYYRIVEIVLEKMNLPAVPRETIFMAAKNDEFNWDMVLPDVPDAMGVSKKETVANAWKMIKKIYPEQFLKNVKPFPDTGNVLQQLSKKNIKIGIVTSTHKNNIRDKLNILKQAGVSNLIETVVCNADVDRKKPFPDPLILCRDRMGFTSEQCVYVGDMGIDIIAGKAAGMKTIGISTGFETRKDLADKNPDAIICSISELPGVLGIQHKDPLKSA